MTVDTLEAEAKRSHQASSPSERVVVFGHSQLLFWWPIWVYGFFLAFYSFFSPQTDAAGSATLLNTLNLVYIVLLAFIITFTNLRLPPVFFIIAALLSTLVIVLIKENTAVRILPSIFNNMHVLMNFEFHLVFNSYIFVIWLLSVTIYDRTEYWSIKQGHIHTHHVFRRDDDELIHPNAANFTRRRDDFVCHWILGLGHVGDIYVRIDNYRTEQLKNVLVSGLIQKIEGVYRR